MARADVIRTATLRLHAGEISVEEWARCVRQFVRRPRRPRSV